VEDRGIGPAFAAWWDAARDDLAQWDLESFFGLMRRWEVFRRERSDRIFLKDWIASTVTAKSGKQALQDREGRRLIAQREHEVRPGKQRLRVKYQLDTWQPFDVYRPTDLYYLQYRHPVGRRFAEDIADGFERGVS
jgi:hypothetical protein